MELERWLKAQKDRVAAVVLAVAGVIALALGWYGVSGATLTTEQLPYLASGGLFGLFLLGAAATAWLSADLRDEWRKLDDIHRALAADRRDDDVIEAEPEDDAPRDSEMQPPARRNGPRSRPIRSATR